jgi:hypothetical protein
MKHKITAFVTVPGLLVALALCGCSSTKSTPAAAATKAPVNTTCPMMGQGVKTNVTVDYHGQTVAFCCEGCVDEWNALSDAERKQKLAGR